MKGKKTSSKKVIIRYGIVLGIVSIIYDLILWLTDNTINVNLIEGFIDLAILTCIITYGIYTYKVANNGFLELGKAIKIGVAIAIIGALILILWIILLMNVIEPEITNQTVDAQYKRMISGNPNMLQEEIEKNMTLIKIYNSYYTISIMSFVSNLLFGFIISLTGGLIMRKKQNL